MLDAALRLFEVSQGNGEEVRFRQASYFILTSRSSHAARRWHHRPPEPTERKDDASRRRHSRRRKRKGIDRNIRRPGTSGNQRDPEMREQTRLRHSAGVGISGTNLVAIRWQFRYLFFLDFCK